MEKNHLYDQKGYEVKLEVTKTYNLSEHGESSDTRDLGVFLTYLGAVFPEKEGNTYDEDPYVLSRLEFPYKSEWNGNAAEGLYGPEENGTWLSAKNIIYLKDTGITRSGLKLVYYVPPFIMNLGAVLRITVCDNLMKEIPLEAEGTFTEILDVSAAGSEEMGYLDKAHRILKILLADFDRVCKKYGLHYYLICGSLLGAVRHGDLIPWDDDVDVAMPRRDFDILLKHACEEWGPENDIMFLNYDKMGNHSFLDYMTRIIYMKEEIPVNVFRKIRGKGRGDVDNHMPMDIYVLDNASDNEKFHKFQTGVITVLYGLAIGHRAYVNPADYENRDLKTRRIVKILSTIGKLIPLSLIFRCYEWVRKWNQNKKCENYFESNGFIYCIPWKFRQEWFGEGEILTLGDMPVCVPQNKEAFLNMHYGDFMKYPPMQVRKPTHSVDASGIF